VKLLVQKIALLGVGGFARRYGNAKKPPLRVYWWNELDNFGDQITPDIVRALWHREVVWAPVESCEVLGAGSILGIAGGEGNYVWGSGYIEDGQWFNPKLRYLAVRGRLTRGRLPAKWQKLPLGDPGILASLVYPVSGKKSGKVGVLPHYVDAGLPLIKKLRRDERFVVLDAHWSPTKVAEEIAQCRLVLSSSLHGLVFADSFGVPCARLRLSDKLTGGEFKFADYDSGVEKQTVVADAARVTDEAYLAELTAAYEPIPELRRKQKALARAWPKEL
jgi:hypothetical protein